MTKDTTRQITARLDAQQLVRVEDWMERQTVPPSFTATLSRALQDFLAKHDPKGEPKEPEPAKPTSLLDAARGTRPATKRTRAKTAA